MNHYRRPSAIISAFTLAAVLLLVYNHFVLLLVSNSSQIVRVAALLPAAAAAGGRPGAVLQSHHDAATSHSLRGAQAALHKQQGIHSLLVQGAPEIWATGPRNGPQQQSLLQLLDAGTLAQLKSLCGRCLYRTLNSYVRAHDFGRITVVLTGDIPAMWTRDSAVQMASYFPRISKRPAIRQMLEGAIRAQSYFILQV
jgi:hypothetical protein